MAKTGMQIRRPRQQRGRERFEAILDAAETLLENAEPSQISIYDVAKYLEVSPPSIYHFFPDPALMFVALAERYLEWFQEVPTEVDEPVTGWQMLLDIQCSRMRAVYDTRASVRKVLLGGGYSPEVRSRDLAVDRIIAGKTLQCFERRFIMPAIPDLLDYFMEMIVINDALWMLSIHQHGKITQPADQKARDARLAYLRTILPERLIERAPAVPAPAPAGKRTAGSGRTSARESGSKPGGGRPLSRTARDRENA